jgi:hypothetical protein
MKKATIAVDAECVGLDPRELQRSSKDRATTTLLPGCDDEPLRRVIGAKAIRFIKERDVTRRTAAALAPEFLQRIRNVPYQKGTIGDALFGNVRVAAPTIALRDVLLALLEAGDLRSTLVARRDALNSEIASLDCLMTVRAK